MNRKLETVNGYKHFSSSCGSIQSFEASSYEPEASQSLTSTQVLDHLITVNEWITVSRVVPPLEAVAVTVPEPSLSPLAVQV